MLVMRERRSSHLQSRSFLPAPLFILSFLSFTADADVFGAFAFRLIVVVSAVFVVGVFGPFVGVISAPSLIARA